MKTLLFIIGCTFWAAPVQAQPSEWTVLQSLKDGQRLQVTIEPPNGMGMLITHAGKDGQSLDFVARETLTAKFHSVTPNELTFRVYHLRRARKDGWLLNFRRETVKEVAVVSKHPSHKFAILGVIFGSALGSVAAQGAGPISIPIDIGLFGGLGAWLDHKSADDNRSVIYVAP